MKVQVIKQEIPAEISESGGASVRIVNKETVELETSIDEAKDQLCVVGDKLLIKGQFVGLFKSMVKGIERDGNARQLGDFLTLYPVPTGEFDLERGWDPAVNGVRIRARLMNEMEIDISNWEFEDITPGRRAFTLESVQAGSVTGVVALDSAIAINGRNLPATADVRVEYAVPERGLSGTVAPAKVVSSATRLDIAADALAALNVQANDGKTIVFTVRGNYANAKISAVLRYVAPTTTVTKVTSKYGDFPESPADTVYPAEDLYVYGTDLKLEAGDEVTWSGVYEGAPVSGKFPASGARQNTPTLLEIDYLSNIGDSFICDADTPMKLTVKGVEKTVTYKGSRPEEVLA